MDPEYYAQDETSTRPAPLPMFVAAVDDYEPSAEPRQPDDEPEGDWVTARMMDSYN